MNGRPAYSSYLPSAYLAEANGLLDHLIQMFEMLMAGRKEEPVRPLLSWVEIENVAPAVSVGLTMTAAGASYNAPRNRLVFLGEMTAAERAALEALVVGAGLTTANQGRHLDAIAKLHQRSQGREEAVPGLERLLDGIARYSSPIEAPGASIDASEGETGYFDDDFVPYLARWVALTLRQHWPDAKRRRLIQIIVPLYKKRGTPDGIRQVLELFIEWPVRIREDLGLVIGERSTVAEDTTVGGTPHFFLVDIPFGYREPGTPPVRFDLSSLGSVVGFTRDVVDQEKPAHTDYAARIQYPGFIIGRYSTIEFDTLIGSTQPTLIRGADSV